MLIKLNYIGEGLKCPFGATRSVSISSPKSAVPEKKICSNSLTFLPLHLKDSISQMNIPQLPPQVKSVLPLVLEKGLRFSIKHNQQKIAKFYRQN
jgi:hypothetical protein